MTSTRRRGVMNFTLSSFHDMARLPLTTYDLNFVMCSYNHEVAAFCQNQ